LFPVPELKAELSQKLLVFQRNEITEYHVYRELARLAREENAEVLGRLAEEELGHYRALAEYTRREVRPRRWRVFLYRLAVSVFGLTFAIKLMEAGERRAEDSYSAVAGAAGAGQDSGRRDRARVGADGAHR